MVTSLLGDHTTLRHDDAEGPVQTIGTQYMKRPIDKIRESALSMEIGEPGERSTITEFVKIADKLHIVTGSAIYRVMLADEIDPERTNPAVPNSQQKVLHYGSESPLVCKTLLTAKQLFGEGSPLADKSDAIRLSFECLRDLVALADSAQAFSEEETSVRSRSFETRDQHRSLILPSTPNLAASCKEFILKSDHSLQSLFGIAKLFYGANLKGWFEGLHSEICRHHGKDTQYCELSREVAVFCKSIRTTRNCIEHPKKNERVDVVDYSLTPRNEVIPPQISVTHPSFNQQAILVSDYMRQVTDHISDIFEILVAFMCSRNLRNLPESIPFLYDVVEMPENTRANKLVRFRYEILLRTSPAQGG
ncbi:MAG: hypothetical protein QM576_03520 [Rhodopseudomonas sp.]|uniref:hypothetical protein n=1 Tax=Rhodopseudomonas sp. TaxID=1078 RepID=UPI0039E44FC4